MKEVVGHGLILGGFWRCVFFLESEVMLFFLLPERVS